MANRSILTLLALAAMWGCNKVRDEIVREVVQAASSAVQAPELKPVSEVEANDYAQRMLAAVAAGDGAGIESALDFDAIVGRALAGVHLPQKVLRDTAKGVAEGARQTGLTAQLAGLSSAGTAFSLLANRVDREGRWLSFRMLPASGGFEHYDMLLSKRDDASVVAADVHFLSAGELMSTSLRRMLIGAFAADKSFIERLSAADNLFIKHLGDINRARQAAVSGQREQAWALLEGLPEELKNQKFALLMRLQLAIAEPDDPRYAKTVATLIEKFPNDPAAAVASIDHFLLRKEYEKAIAAIEAVEKSATPDAYFGVLKAETLRSMDKLEEAREVALATIEREPGLLPAHFSLVGVLLQRKDHAATAAKLLQMRDQFELVYEFEDIPEYAAFVASSEYPAFKRQLARGAQ
jgi:tetratricopeptide (TPR) repeat protein